MRIMFEYLINILILIGCIVAALGGCCFVLFGSMIIIELMSDTLTNLKLKLLKNQHREDEKILIMKRLDDLKERYPDLEIDYKMK